MGCGDVVLKFFNPQPRIALECGCCDCRQAMIWAQEQGGPKAPLMPLLKYLENDLVVEKGKEKMKWFKLREDELGGKSVRCVTTCCYSTIAVDHPFYNVIEYISRNTYL